MNELPIILIGAGPANLMAAQKLAERGFRVEIYEQNAAAARKFLVAGHGGFNLTHDEDMSQFIQRYSREELTACLNHFDNKQTRRWLQDLGIPTYVGSSGKIFPQPPIKPIQVLQAWLDRLNSLGVHIFYKQKFTDFTSDTVCINGVHKKFYKLIVGLGGGSWSKTGSDGLWTTIFQEKGIAIAALQAANSGFNTCADFNELEGQYLKNIVVNYKEYSRQGEFVFSNYGIEGSPLYFMNRYLRNDPFPLTLAIDLKPSYSLEKVQKLLKSKKPVASVLKNELKLSNTAIILLKKLPKESYTDPLNLASSIKKYPIVVHSFRPIDEVISTAGGIKFEELSEYYALTKYPNVYCIGEMVDWEAPTGGYLLQACFSMGAWVAANL